MCGPLKVPVTKEGLKLISSIPKRKAPSSAAVLFSSLFSWCFQRAVCLQTQLLKHSLLNIILCSVHIMSHRMSQNWWQIVGKSCALLIQPTVARISRPISSHSVKMIFLATLTWQMHHLPKTQTGGHLFIQRDLNTHLFNGSSESDKRNTDKLLHGHNIW